MSLYKIKKSNIDNKGLYAGQDIKDRTKIIEYKGKILQRVRLGPTQEIEIADEVLKKVFELGFNGSKIIVD